MRQKYPFTEIRIFKLKSVPLTSFRDGNLLNGKYRPAKKIALDCQQHGRHYKISLVVTEKDGWDKSNAASKLTFKVVGRDKEGELEKIVWGPDAGEGK